MDGLSGRALGLVPALVEDGVALGPDLFGHDRLNRREDPVLARLELPLLPLPEGLGVVGAARTLRNRVADEPVNGRVRELPAAPGAVPLLVEQSGDGLLPLVFQEQFVDELADRGFPRIGEKLLVLPLVAERRGSAGGLAELGANRDRGRHAFGDLLALPLRHRRNHRVEEAAGRRRRIDGLLERHEVRVVFAEDVGEVEEFARVPSEPGELGEDQAGDVPRGDVAEHPLRLGMPHDGFPTHRFEVVGFANLPTLRLSVRLGASLVMLWALALSLIFSRNADPNTHALRLLLAIGCPWFLHGADSEGLVALLVFLHSLYCFGDHRRHGAALFFLLLGPGRLVPHFDLIPAHRLLGGLRLDFQAVEQFE